MRPSTNTNTIVVRLVEDDLERERTVSFISKRLFKEYANSPDEATTPDTLFVAQEVNEIVGALALEFGDPDQPLSFEALYRFDQSRTPLPFCREKTTYYCRLTTQKPGVCIPLMYVAIIHAITRKRLFGSCVLKPHVTKLLRQYGLNLLLITEAKIIIKNISAADRKYFLSSPSPRLYLFDLKKTEEVLRPKIQNLVNAGELVLELSQSE